MEGVLSFLNLYGASAVIIYISDDIVSSSANVTQLVMAPYKHRVSCSQLVGSCVFICT